MAGDIKNTPMPRIPTSAPAPSTPMRDAGKVGGPAGQATPALSTRTGIYNVQSEEGRAAVQKTLLDLGLGMPQFLSVGSSAVLKAMPPEGKVALGELGKAVAAMASTGGTSPTGMSGIQAQWADFVSKTKVGGATDINALVQAVLREAYLENSQDLAFFAQKVRFYNDLKKNLRDELTRAREILAQQAGRKETEGLSTGAFNGKDFDTTFTGTSGAQGTDQLTPQQEAQLAQQQAAQEAEAARRAEIQAAYDAQVAAAQANPVALTVPARVTGKSGDGGGNEITDQNSNCVRDTGNAWKQNVMDWLATLTPEERTALEEKLRTEGMTVSATGNEGGSWDSTDNVDAGSISDKLGPNESLEDFFGHMCDDVIDKQVTAYFAEESKPEPESFSFSMSLPSVSSVRLPDAPPELAAGSSGMTGAGGDGVAWKEGDPVRTKADLEAYIKGKEEQLNSVGDDAQLANVDLQNILQKQQQTLQLLSNVSKQLHDTALAIIRKIGG